MLIMVFLFLEMRYFLCITNNFVSQKTN